MKRIRELVSVILEDNPERVFIQVPEGLKKKVKVLQDELDKKDTDSIVSLEPCYGACDIKDTEAMDLGCDILVHIGHTRFCKDEKIRTIYFPWYYQKDPVPILESSIETVQDFENIGLLAAANFRPSFEKAKEFFESNGFTVLSDAGERVEEGQILGCDVSSAMAVEEDVDCFIYIGSGMFHPLGLALETDKPIFRLDFEEGSLKMVDFDRFQRQCIVAQEQAKEAEDFGILVTTKKGQSRPDLAFELKDMLKEAGRNVSVFVMDEITPEKLEGIDVDCFVNTACPRIAVEHRTAFRCPILNPRELKNVFKNLKM